MERTTSIDKFDPVVRNGMAPEPSVDRPDDGIERFEVIGVQHGGPSAVLGGRAVPAEAQHELIIVELDLAADVGVGLQRRMQGEEPGGALQGRGKSERIPETVRRHTSHPGELPAPEFGRRIDAPGPSGGGGEKGEDEEVALQANLVDDPPEGGGRPVGEAEVGHKGTA